MLLTDQMALMERSERSDESDDWSSEAPRSDDASDADSVKGPSLHQFPPRSCCHHTSLTQRIRDYLESEEDPTDLKILATQADGTNENQEAAMLTDGSEDESAGFRSLSSLQDVSQAEDQEAAKLAEPGGTASQIIAEIVEVLHNIKRVTRITITTTKKFSEDETLEEEGSENRRSSKKKYGNDEASDEEIAPTCDLTSLAPANANSSPCNNEFLAFEDAGLLEN